MDNDGRVRELYNDAYHRLVGQLYAICGDLQSAEEVVQEAFVRAMTHGRSFRSAENPQAWLRRVALNLQRNRWRSSRTAARLFDQAHPRTRVIELSPDHVALVTALRGIPLEQREAVVLHHIADLPVHEIAESLGVPVGTVKARLSRGRAALALLLDDVEEEGHV